MRKHDQKEEVNAILKKKSAAVLKPNMKPKGNKMKVQNKGGFSKQKNSKKLQSRNTVQIICYNCNKPKHLARNCRNRNRPVA